MKRRQAENLRKRLLILGISIIVMGLATSILRPIAFGSDPYTTVNMGIDRVTPISFGTAELLVNGVLLIFVFFADRSQIGIGTLLNMLCIGYISDFFLWIWNSVFPSGVFEQPVVRYLLLPVGLILFILSCAGYMGAQLGVSAYDAIPVYLEKKLPQIPGRLIRMAWDWLFILLGWAMGASFGIVTILMAFLLGPTIAAVRGWFKKIHLV